MKKCIWCGAEIENDDLFCDECGKKQDIELFNQEKQRVAQEEAANRAKEEAAKRVKEEAEKKTMEENRKQAREEKISEHKDTSSFLKTLWDIVCYVLGAFILFFALVAFEDSISSGVLLTIGAVICFPFVRKLVRKVANINGFLFLLCVVVCTFWALMIYPSSDELEGSTNNTANDNIENTTEELYVFTQVGLYQHDAYAHLGENVPKIVLYSNGTFEFTCNHYDRMETLIGKWSLEKETPKTYHCYVDNCPELPNLDFYLYHNEARCDADFYSDYNEFGMTSMEEILFHCESISTSTSTNAPTKISQETTLMEKDTYIDLTNETSLFYVKIYGKQYNIHDLNPQSLCEILPGVQQLDDVSWQDNINQIAVSFSGNEKQFESLYFGTDIGCIYKDICVGMSKQTVINILGNPNKSKNGTEFLWYFDENGMKIDDESYSYAIGIYFENDKVRLVGIVNVAAMLGL